MSGIVFILDGYMLINMCILCVAMKTSPNYKGPSGLNSQQQYEWEDLVVGAHVGPLTLCLHVTTGCMIECCLALSQASKSGNYQAGCHIKKKTLKANISIMCSSSRRKYAKIMHVSHTHYNFCPQVVHGAQIAGGIRSLLQGGSHHPLFACSFTIEQSSLTHPCKCSLHLGLLTVCITQ